MSGDRVALVTGAGSGIGRAIAEALAAAGAAVLCADLRGDRAGETAAAIRAAGGKAAAHAADVAEEASVQSMVDAALQRFGSLGILVNNAGLQHVAPIEEFPLQAWNRLLAVMLTGPFLATKAALPHMRRAGWGRIINMSSAHGKVASPFKAAYIAAKHGIIGLTRATAVETATDGITCNAICPGATDTPLVRAQVPDLMQKFGVQSEQEALERAFLQKTPVGRLARVEEIAALAVYLASESAAMVTGQAISIDGGWVMA